METASALRKSVREEMMTQCVRILIVDDHDDVRKAIRRLLESRLEFEICGEAKDGAEAVAKSSELKPDVVILNLSMPIMNGFEAARRSSCYLRTLMRSWSRKRKRSGRSANVVKADAERELIAAVNAAARGESSAVV